MQLSKPLLFQTLCYAVGVSFKDDVITAAQEPAFYEKPAPFARDDVLVRGRS